MTIITANLTVKNNFQNETQSAETKETIENDENEQQYSLQRIFHMLSALERIENKLDKMIDNILQNEHTNDQNIASLRLKYAMPTEDLKKVLEDNEVPESKAINLPHNLLETNGRQNLTIPGTVTCVYPPENTMQINNLIADAKINTKNSSCTANQQRAAPTLDQDTTSTLRDLHKPGKWLKSKIEEKTFNGIAPTLKINYHWYSIPRYFTIKKPPRKAKRRKNNATNTNVFNGSNLAFPPNLSAVPATQV